MCTVSSVLTLLLGFIQTAHDATVVMFQLASGVIVCVCVCVCLVALGVSSEVLGDSAASALSL